MLADEENASVGSQSNFSIGEEMQFGAMRAEFARENVNKACCDFIIDLLFLLFIVMLVQFSLADTHASPMVIGSHQKLEATCGVPVLMWLQVFFALFGLRSFF